MIQSAITVSFCRAQSPGVAAHRMERVDVLRNIVIKKLPGKLR